MLGGKIVRRSWGWYAVVLDRGRFKVKLLRFKAGARMSVQRHTHRSELWLHLSGPLAGEWRLYPAGESHTFRPDSAACVLEVQFGEKCVEEDIIRE
jgi:mannose-6-phosphate isomerase-like protein (cupin superfamily)